MDDQQTPEWAAGPQEETAAEAFARPEGEVARMRRAVEHMAAGKSRNRNKNARSLPSKVHDRPGSASWMGKIGRSSDHKEEHHWRGASCTRAEMAERRATSTGAISCFRSSMKRATGKPYELSNNAV